eukprot:TRINITY_DN2161_c0_g1_i1.p1 TRINITY_DN2161_c0_g1~~TRINITY_DN2161_c0_g1_i1.p1  ORF type:complete len:194 (+),score=28.95 TRINITY_DN2161_c0_g1_i1:125-706(+)
MKWCPLLQLKDVLTVVTECGDHGDDDQVGIPALRVTQSPANRDHVGMVVWKSAFVMCSYVESTLLPDMIIAASVSATTMCILEMGSGTGSVGLSLAHKLQQQVQQTSLRQEGQDEQKCGRLRVVLTDQAPVIPLLQHNVELNYATHELRNGCDLDVMAMEMDCGHTQCSNSASHASTSGPTPSSSYAQSEHRT